MSVEIADTLDESEMFGDDADNHIVCCVDGVNGREVALCGRDVTEGSWKPGCPVSCALCVEEELKRPPCPDWCLF